MKESKGIFQELQETLEHYMSLGLSDEETIEIIDRDIVERERKFQEKYSKQN